MALRERAARAIMAVMSAPTIAVIGGGFSGTMVAYHLMRLPGGPRRVVLIERQPPAARGVAYGTPHEQHLLNVPAGRMGADPADPDGFVRFLGGGDPGAFVPRRRKVQPGRRGERRRVERGISARLGDAD